MGGFVYFEQTCYLKGGSISTAPNDGRTSRVRVTEPTCLDFEAELADTDLTGDDLSSIWMEAPATIDDCCSLCDGRVSRVRRSEPRCSDFEAQANDTDLSGELLSSLLLEGNVTVDDCCPLCDETE